MNKEQLLELINSKIAGQGSAVDIGGALAPVLVELVTSVANLDEQTKTLEDKVANSGGITVALNFKDDPQNSFDPFGLSEQLNYCINTYESMCLRKYFGHLNAEVLPSSETSIDINFFYTWDDGSYFAASGSIAADYDGAGYVIVVGEFALNDATDRYTDDWETIINPELRLVFERMDPGVVLKPHE